LITEDAAGTTLFLTASHNQPNIPLVKVFRLCLPVSPDIIETNRRVHLAMTGAQVMITRKIVTISVITDHTEMLDRLPHRETIATTGTILLDHHLLLALATTTNIDVIIVDLLLLLRAMKTIELLILVPSMITRIHLGMVLLVATLALPMVLLPPLLVTPMRDLRSRKDLGRLLWKGIHPVVIPQHHVPGLHLAVHLGKISRDIHEITHLQLNSVDVTPHLQG
jgi:hypothetical protein